jgi:hypothetical protein
VTKISAGFIVYLKTNKKLSAKARAITIFADYIGFWGG